MRFLSQVYTIARGSVGGITYLANQYHQLVARARTAPVQPNTPWQTGIRSAFDVADDDWDALTQAEKDLWGDYAATCQYQGPLGSYTVPGRNLFIGTIALSKYADALSPGLITLDPTPPAIAGFYNPGTIQTTTYVGGAQGIGVSVGVPPGEPVCIVVDRSFAFSTARNTYKGPYLSAQKTIVMGPAGATSLVYIDTPVATIDKVIFTRVRLFTAAASPATGIPHRLSALFYLRHIPNAGGP